MKKQLSYAAQASAGNLVLDATPEKSASLTYFHFDGDSALYNLVQNAQVNLQHCIDGYSKSVMLKDNFSAVGQTKPTKVLKPNREVFLDQLNELVNEGYYVDIFIFAHGSPDRIYMANDKSLCTADLKELAEASKFKLLPIRIVYQMNCYGHTFNQTWLDIGAKSVCGARGVNFWSNQFNKFASDWAKGNVPFEKAVYDSNTASARTVMETLILADASSSNKVWGNCPFLKTVLGDDPCAKDYFCTIWHIDDVWQKGKSGKENMDYSSFMFTPGANITKNDKKVLEWSA